jgi:hypothetical protein
MKNVLAKYMFNILKYKYTRITTLSYVHKKYD